MGGLLSVAALGGGFFFFSKPSDKPLESYTLLSHDVDRLEANPIGYTSLLRELSDAKVTEDERLRLAAKRLLAIDTDPKTYQCRHELLALEKALYQVLLAYYQWTVNKPPQIQVIKGEAESFLYDRLSNPKPAYYALSFGQHRLNTFDKEIRALGGRRFSPLFYNEGLAVWMKANVKAFKMTSFIEQWLRHIKPYVEALHKRLGSDEEKKRLLRQHYLLTFLFDLHSIKRLFEHKGVEAWVTLVQRLKGSVWEERERGKACLVALYREQKPDIICLQGCDTALVEALTREGYFTPQHVGEGSAPLFEGGSVILYRKDVFQRKEVTLLSLDMEDMALPSYAVARAKGFLGLLGREIAVHKVYHRGMVWLVSSLHAHASGDNTLSFLRALFALQKRIEEEEGCRVLLLLGMDAHTSSASKVIKDRLKCDLKAVDKLLEGYQGRYVRVEHKGEDVGTVRKERSTFQMQLREAHVPLRHIADFILVSRAVHVKRYKKDFLWVAEHTYLGPYGPNLTTNPSCHRAIVVKFRLQASDDSAES